jgi:hypothetical protein
LYVLVVGKRRFSWQNSAAAVAAAFFSTISE